MIASIYLWFTSWFVLAVICSYCLSSWLWVNQGFLPFCFFVMLLLLQCNISNPKHKESSSTELSHFSSLSTNTSEEACSVPPKGLGSDILDNFHFLEWIHSLKSPKTLSGVAQFSAIFRERFSAFLLVFMSCHLWSSRSSARHVWKNKQSFFIFSNKTGTPKNCFSLANGKHKIVHTLVHIAKQVNGAPPPYPVPLWGVGVPFWLPGSQRGGFHSSATVA